MICKHCKLEIRECKNSPPLSSHDGGSYCLSMGGWFHVRDSSHVCHECGGAYYAKPAIIEETKEINFKELCENAADRVVDIIVDIYGDAGKEMFKQAVIFILKEELDKMTLST